MFRIGHLGRARRAPSVTLRPCADRCHGCRDPVGGWPGPPAPACILCYGWQRCQGLPVRSAAHTGPARPFPGTHHELTEQLWIQVPGPRRWPRVATARPRDPEGGGGSQPSDPPPWAHVQQGVLICVRQQGTPRGARGNRKYHLPDLEAARPRPRRGPGSKGDPAQRPQFPPRGFPPCAVWVPVAHSAWSPSSRHGHTQRRDPDVSISAGDKIQPMALAPSRVLTDTV